MSERGAQGRPGIDPQRLRRWLIVAAVVYLILPRDLVPDFLGRGLGYLEDVILIGLAAYAYRRYVRRHAAPASGSPGAQGAGQASGPPERFDPYAILGISRPASREEVQAAYRARMGEYHPDKVAHLGEELQELAHEKAVLIQRAYEQLGG